MRLCKNCLMAHIDDPTGTHTVRRLNFSDGFHRCKRCAFAALYFVMTLERVEAEKNF